MLGFIKIDSVSEFLEINSQERDLLCNLKTEEKTTVFKKIMSGDIGLSLVIRFSELDEEFFNICNSEELKEHWRNLWSLMGLAISKKVTHKPVPFYIPAKHSSSFQFVKGLFFFDKAFDIHQLINGEDSLIVEEFLIKAISCGSIHALQLYCEQKYKKESENFETSKVIYTDIINNCSKMKAIYGSYALSMLAQAYFLYALLLKYNNQPVLAKVNKRAALFACDEAAKSLSSSQYSIFNASFGEGFSRSNLLELDNPNKMKEYIAKNF